MKINRYTITNTPLQLKIAILADIHDKPFPLEPLRGLQKVDLILIPGDITKYHLCEEAWQWEQKELVDKYGIPKHLVANRNCSEII